MIVLDDEYTIEEDDHSWNLVRRTPTLNKQTGRQGADKEGNPTFQEQRAYHPTLAVALTDYLDKSLKGCTGLLDVLKRISEAEERIKRAVR